MEKKQSQTPDLEIKKASESLTEQDLNTISGGVTILEDCNPEDCGKNCFSK